MFDQFDRDFDRHAKRIRNLMILSIAAMLTVFGSLIGLAVYAINKFAG